MVEPKVARNHQPNGFHPFVLSIEKNIANPDSKPIIMPITMYNKPLNFLKSYDSFATDFNIKSVANTPIKKINRKYTKFINHKDNAPAHVPQKDKQNFYKKLLFPNFLTMAAAARLLRSL
jgi:hypothetical protein